MSLKCEGVSIALGQRQVLNNVSFEVEAGEFVGLVGPNGSGKTTLLRTIYRALRPDKGLIIAGDANVWKMTPTAAACRIAAVLQEREDVELTVEQVVRLGRLPHRATQSDDKVTSALARVGLINLSARVFNTLSGGEKQRVLIARALAQLGHVLVLDEPTNHLDIRHQLDVLDIISSLGGVSTLAALHDLNLAAAYCDRILVLNHGQIVASGIPAAVLTSKLVNAVFDVQVAHVRHPLRNAIQLLFTDGRSSPEN